MPKDLGGAGVHRASEPLASLSDRAMPVAVVDDRVDRGPLASRSVALRVAVPKQLADPLLGLLARPAVLFA